MKYPTKTEEIGIIRRPLLIEVIQNGTGIMRDFYFVFRGPEFSGCIFFFSNSGNLFSKTKDQRKETRTFTRLQARAKSNSKEGTLNINETKNKMVWQPFVTAFFVKI